MSSDIEKNSTPSTRKYPFVNMKIDDTSILNNIEGRFLCTKCNRSRKFFCYNCLVPVGDLENIIPKVDIPVNIDIIKHKKEISGKSTAIHAAILSRHVRIYIYPDIPDYTKEKDVVLIFPSPTSRTVSQLFEKKTLKTDDNCGLPKEHSIDSLLHVEELPEKECSEKVDAFNKLPIRRAVFIDSTWNQTKGIYKDNRIRCLPTIILRNRCSQFWRHQHGPRWFLATIEAIHQFLLEVHVNAWGLNSNYRGLDNLEIAQAFFDMAKIIKTTSNNCLNKEEPYNGHYDNLMFFFANMYDLIHRYYDHNQLKSYRRPI